MRKIKSNYKKCPACGKKINWKKANRMVFKNYEDANNTAIYLDNREESEELTAKELYERMRDENRT